VRAIDEAGNVGNPTAAAVFSVDEALLTPDEQAAKDEADRARMRTIIVVVIVVLGGVAAVAAAVAVVLCRRRVLRRRREPPRTMYVYNPALAGSHPGGSGYPLVAPGPAGRGAAADSALEAALRQSRADYEEQQRVDAAIQASLAEEASRARQGGPGRVQYGGSEEQLLHGGSQHHQGGAFAGAGAGPSPLGQQQQTPRYSAPVPVGLAPPVGGDSRRSSSGRLAGVAAVAGRRISRTAAEQEEWELQQAIQASLREQGGQGRWQGSEPGAAQLRRALGQ
jgi:hypothetical protein